MSVKIKICGLTREEDIAAANEAAPDYIGFVFAPRSRRYVTRERAERLKVRLDGKILAIGVFADADESTVCSLAERRVIDLIQLHGNEPREAAERLKERTGLPVIKAVSMTSADADGRLRLWEDSAADYLLLDSGAGGTGRAFDHHLIGVRKKPFFLAGGLTTETIGEIAARVRPFAVDVSSGVETDGKKDREKMIEAVRRIRNA